MFKLLIGSLFAFLLYLSLGHLYYWQTGDFRLANVLPATSLSLYTNNLKNWEFGKEAPQNFCLERVNIAERQGTSEDRNFEAKPTQPKTNSAGYLCIDQISQEEFEKIKDALAQPYFYLGHGNQTYVFGSTDGEYVLKLFKKEYLTRTWLKHLFPPVPPFRSFLLHQGARRSYRTERLINGYRVSYLYDPGHSGLIYLHLNPEISFGQVMLIDGLRRSDSIPISSYLFVLQKKVISAREEFLRLIALGDQEGIRERLRQLFSLYREQMSRGLYDEDRNLIDNTGFISARQCQIEALRSERQSLSPSGKGEEEDRFGKVAVSQDASLKGDCGVDGAIRQDAGKVVYNERYRDPKKIRKELKALVAKRLGPWFRRHGLAHSDELIIWMEKEVN